jgi:hypothetical protein
MPKNTPMLLKAHSKNGSSVKIKKGSILIYRIYDVAEEISVSRVEEILRDNRGPDRFKVPKYIDRAIVMKSPPVTFGLGEEVLHTSNGDIRMDAIVKIRDFGTMTLTYQMPINGLSWTELIKLAVTIEEGSDIDSLAEQQMKEISSQIKSSFKKPSTSSAFEDYIIYFIEEFEDGMTAKDLLQNVDIPSLLTAENSVKLSEGLRKVVMETVHQYSENDMTMIEWNSALVVEPSGGREIPDILEFAVTQLMEMRYYDEVLDVKLAKLYDDIEKKRTKIVIGSRFDKSAEEASAKYIEFTEFIERVENSLKVVGDFYLATVYRAATKRFRVSDWQSAVTRKMNIMAQVSSLLQAEINNRRSHLLEIIIIFLICYEILSAALKWT